MIAALVAESMVIPCVLRTPQMPPQTARLQEHMKLGVAMSGDG